MNVPIDPIVSSVRARLEGHPHFHGRTRLLQIQSCGDCVIVSGRLPSYHLKQLLQEVIKAVPDVGHVDNRVDVP